MALPTITNNSPSAGRIAWSGFGIQYDGVGYSVPAGNSASKFIWWQYNNGAPTVQAADTLPDLAPEDYLLFLNKNGIGTLVDTTQVIDGSLIVSGSVLADGIGANQIQTYHLTANAVTTDKLAANSVTATEVAAGAVTAEKLSIGAVGDNMVLNGSFEDGTQGFSLVASGAGAIADVVTGVSSSGANALRLVRGTAANLIVGQDLDHFIPVTSVAGRSWYVACRAGAGSALASGFYLRIYWFQADKVTAASTAYVDVASNVALTTAWSVFEGAVTPPANARYMRVAVINELSGSTMYVDEITAHEVVVAAQIGDGQITTAKLVANAVTAEKITANAVTAAKVAANAITATQLAANAVTAAKISANAVTAAKIEATAIDGKTITGATVRTAASGQRTQLDTIGLRTFNASGTETARIAADGSGLRLTGPLVSVDDSATAAARFGVGIVELTSNLGTGWTDRTTLTASGLSTNIDSGFYVGNDSNEAGTSASLYSGSSPSYRAGITVSTGSGGAPSAVVVDADSVLFKGDQLSAQNVNIAGYETGWSPGAQFRWVKHGSLIHLEGQTTADRQLLRITGSLVTFPLPFPALGVALDGGGFFLDVTTGTFYEMKIRLADANTAVMEVVRADTVSARRVTLNQVGIASGNYTRWRFSCSYLCQL